MTQTAHAASQPLLFEVEEHTHDKKGWQYFICTMSERVERAEFDRMLYAARAVGGWYARAWAGRPSGFAFKDEAKALAFVADNGSTASHVVRFPAAAAAPRQPVNLAPKLRELAAALQPMIDDKYRDRLSNTPKRACQAAKAMNEGHQIEKAQKIALALAACHEGGTVPPALAKIATKAALIDLGKEEIDTSRSGYYDAGHLTGKPSPWGPTAELRRLAWGLLDIASCSEGAAAARLKAEIDGLRFKKIAGYFATPRTIVNQMIERARLKGGDHVLEPSAGSGAIADELVAMGCQVNCFEVNSQLCAILKTKGHNVAQFDCTEHTGMTYDAVLMNPPFENGQDVEHVRHCFELVKSGGVLVAIMGAGASFRNDGKYKGFRDWLDDLGGEMVALPENSFKESGTTVGTVIVEIWKP